MAKFAPSIEKITDQVFLVLAYDDENHRDIRNSSLDGHLEFIEQNYERYLTCGPLRLVDKKKIIGSFFLVTSENENELRSFLNNDPYFNRGLYGKLRILNATPAAGSWMGGVIWDNAEEIRPNAS
ncbi:MAG TPA: YciI family protein [Woeseiaceae bacterium]|jgi:uncharacterized protein YciI|nr:YciI family protein [Woeseiaceae bacterium]